MKEKQALARVMVVAVGIAIASGLHYLTSEVDPIVWTKFWPSLDGGAG